MVQGICFMGDGDERFEDCSRIRKKVFVREQKVDPEEEFDGMDDAAAHVLIYDEDGNPVATGRMLGMGEATFKIGRLAVLKEYRKMGYGQLAVLLLMDKARQCGGKRIYIEAQSHAKRFYEKLGFKTSGDAFMEVGIEHVPMVCELGEMKGCSCCK